jgi:hypothetical protein
MAMVLQLGVHDVQRKRRQLAADVVASGNSFALDYRFRSEVQQCRDELVRFVFR